MSFNEQELNEKWDIHKVVDEAVRGALNYGESSRASAIAIAQLETNYINMDKKLDDNQILNEKAHEAIMTSMKEFHLSTNSSLKEMNDKLDKALEKKADVWVERFMIWAGIIIGGGILGYVGSLLIKVIELK